MQINMRRGLGFSGTTWWNCDARLEIEVDTRVSIAQNGSIVTKGAASVKTYNVHITWKYPAWDEKSGADITVSARSKADAIKSARREMRNGGHTGVMYFKATEVNAEPYDPMYSYL